MTTKMFCDGCDKEIEDRREKKIVIAYPSRPGAIQPPNGEYDLCESCFDHFRFQHLPKYWARVAMGKVA